MEAEAEKRAQKEKLKNSSKKDVLKENNSIESNKTLKRKRKSAAENSPPPKRMTRSSKTNEKEEKIEIKPILTTPKSTKSNFFFLFTLFSFYRAKMNLIDVNFSIIDKPSKPSMKSPLINPFTLAISKKNSPENKSKMNDKKNEVLTIEESDLIKQDTANKKLWDECIEIIENDGRQVSI